jgi:hypothetical protein
VVSVEGFYARSHLTELNDIRRLRCRVASLQLD